MFSAFGALSPIARMADADRAWTVANTFADWNPSTKEGLETHQLATNQMQFSFRAGGATFGELGPLASDGVIKVTASQLLPNSILYLQVDAEYTPFTDGGATSPPVAGGLVWLSFSDDLQSAALHDETGRYETEGAAKLKSEADGRVSILVRLRLRRVPAGPIEMENLTIKLRLDVLGDGTMAKSGDNGSIVVPTMKGGAKVVRVMVVRARTTSTEELLSHELKALS